MNRGPKYSYRTIRVRIPVATGAGSKTRGSNYGRTYRYRSNKNNGGNQNKKGQVIRILRNNEIGRSRPIRTSIKTTFYKKKYRGRGPPILEYKSINVYSYEKPVDTIFSDKETINEVKVAFTEKFEKKQDFESDGEKFKYEFGDSKLKIASSPSASKYLESCPNTNEFVATHLINQYLIPPVMRLPYLMLYTEMDIIPYKLDGKQVEAIIEKGPNEEIIKAIDSETKKKNVEKIETIMNKVISNIEIDKIGQLSKILDVKRIYTAVDDLVGIAKNLNLDQLKKQPDIEYTYYTTKSNYWRPFLPALANYDPREIILVATIQQKFDKILFELGVGNNIVLNELNLFLATVLEKKEFSDSTMGHYMKSLEMYTIIY